MRKKVYHEKKSFKIKITYFAEFLNMYSQGMPYALRKSIYVKIFLKKTDGKAE